MAAPTKADVFAWRNKGYADGEAGRPISPTLRGQTAKIKSVYFEGRRCAINEKNAAAA